MSWCSKISQRYNRATWSAPWLLFLLQTSSQWIEGDAFRVSPALLSRPKSLRHPSFCRQTLTANRFHEPTTASISSSLCRKQRGLLAAHIENPLPNLSNEASLTLDRLQQQPLPQEPLDEQPRQQPSQFLNWSDVRMVVVHLLSCVLVALSLCAWEDYTVSFVPHDTAVPRRSHAILGLAYGQEGFKVMPWNADAIDPMITADDETTTTTTTTALPGIAVVTTWPPRAYNDILLEHRTEHVPRWKTMVTSEATVREATRNIYQALQAVDQLGTLADDYEWDRMRAMLQAPVLRQTLEQACNTLQSATPFLTPEARREIGFHWGSCAWRHCGAQADAQEALDELDQMLGVLEPFECQFVLDIVERSLRDVLAVVPAHLHPTLQEQPWRPTKDYRPYESPPPPALPDWLFSSETT